MKRYLLDTNYLIYLADPKADSNKKAEVLRDFEDKLQASEALFFLTSLIRHEVLRGVDWNDTDRLKKLKEVLRRIQTIEINNHISDLARNLFRLDRAKQELVKQKQNGEINNDISDLARNLFRLDRAKQELVKQKQSGEKNIEKNIEKYQFDIFHFATAKIYNLEILSKDRDMKAIGALYEQYEREKNDNFC